MHFLFYILLHFLERYIFSFVYFWYHWLNISVFNIYSPFCNGSLFSKNITLYCMIDKARVFARFTNYHRSFYDFLTFHFLSETLKRIQYVRLVTMRIRTSRIISTTGGSLNDPWRRIFFPDEPSLLPGRPRVTTLTTATGRHYWLRLSLLTTFIAELGYVLQDPFDPSRRTR